MNNNNMEVKDSSTLQLITLFTWMV